MGLFDFLSKKPPATPPPSGPRPMPRPLGALGAHPEPKATNNFIVITLDSCRYDTFAAVAPTNLSRLGPLHRACAPSYFTFGSHCAMFANM